MTKLTSSQSSLADELLSAGCIKFGEFTLKSGLKSPIYIDLRQIITYPKLLEKIGQAYLPILKDLKFDRIAGLPYAAIPIATAISLAGNHPMIYPRKEVKTYGTKAEIEGEYHTGETIVVIDEDEHFDHEAYRALLPDVRGIRLSSRTLDRTRLEKTVRSFGRSTLVVTPSWGTDAVGLCGRLGATTRGIVRFDRRPGGIEWCLLE